MTVAACAKLIDEQRFESIYEAVVANGDTNTAERIHELAQQWKTSYGKTYVAFCGLFSAGKSSLLNTICHEKALATGAVPTTATIAQVFLPDANEKVVLMDTPGVDSTDDSHRKATEEALHLADVIVLVMDYQHVESMENLELARSFSEQGKRLVLIVNQVDKHFDFELSFSDFDARVQQVMEDYEIYFEKLFYTSSESSPYNQVDQFITWLMNLASESDMLREQSYQKRLSDLVAAHVQNQFAEERSMADERLVIAFGSLPASVDEAKLWLHESREEMDEITKQIEETISLTMREQDELREELVRLVELAQISPYDTTERGRMYVESLRPEFKVGWFRQKQKTAHEQVERLSAFVQDLESRTEKYLIWPLQGRLRQLVQSMDYADREWAEEVESVTYQITADKAAAIVKPGALVSSHYPYQYVKDVVSAIKRMILIQLGERLDNWFAKIISRVKDAKAAEFNDQHQQIEQKVESMSIWLSLKDKELQLHQTLMSGNGAAATK
jgi:small GTP-binding protein